ncbi:cupin [Paenibacillus albidus]|uniref:Cupin n=1 Tax=Paenibacillus albidus TaxID=2041023 RepID=A0A917CXM7_9BACL|nr:cupin [Paenibacillus albidus]GGG00354.1 cupin [Paenibacillus albidus]
MKIYQFTQEAGKAIEAFGSRELHMSRILSEASTPHIGCMYLGENGRVGWHQAGVPQLFLVVSGGGWVRGGDGPEVSIRAGYAAYWEQGEWHETRTDNGLTAIVIESESLNIAMIPIQE